MTIRLIKKGTKPEERIYRGTCSICSSVVEASPSDGKVTSDQRDGNFFTFPCPNCGRQMHISIDARNLVSELKPLL